ncbi:hypothetical protein OU790_09065, partial [Ruegeria sp. NA]
RTPIRAQCKYRTPDQVNMKVSLITLLKTALSAMASNPPFVHILTILEHPLQPAARTQLNKGVPSRLSVSESLNGIASVSPGN